MGRHLILAVHGIGEQKPGETVDAIVGAATTDLVDGNSTQTPRARRSNGPVDVYRDLIELPEKEFDGTPRKAKLFPVNLRRVRPAQSKDSANETVFAEVFWADKSPAPQGFFRTAFDLLSVILGLGYIGMDNVENTRTKPSIALFHGFTWAFYGLVAPLNAVLLIGALLLLIDVTPLDIGVHIPTALTLLGQGLIALAIAALIFAVARLSYLIRIFAMGLAGFGVLIVLIWAAYQVPLMAWLAYGIETAHASIMPWFGGSGGPLCATPTKPPDSFQLRADPNGSLECVVTYTVTFLEASWFLTIALGFLVLVSSWFMPRSAAEPANEQSDTLYPAIVGAMIMFWMTFTSSFWFLFQNLVARLSTARGHPEHTPIAKAHQPDGFLHGIFHRQFGDAQDTLGLSIYALGFFLLAAFTVVFIRRFSRDALRAENPSPWIGRVILHPFLSFFLKLFVVAIFALAVALFLDARFDPAFMAEGTYVRSAMNAVAFDEARNGTIGAIALGLGVLIYNFPSFVAGALGVVRDIVSYAVQARCICRVEDGKYRANFILRNDINRRFTRVLHYTLETMTPSRITIISHSQGTVIATQMLQSGRVHDLLAKYGNPPVTLITMGSPVTQVYRHYFPHAFKVSTDKMPDGLLWHNIYRIDDYVGTRIDEDTGVKQNLDVDAAGHLGYFTDYQVWTRMWEDVGFQLFDRPTGKVRVTSG
ncbi:hypothetical protein [Tateyamaria sp. ANG-S1]|uniref:hypothetical protein n=1 Tax=Tateyamaria sp. ANG-S1 TaxID=1577905 RepID=UPI00057CF7B7|nr:hypothetical protein [Tateyamaria sp. ANG-S1]KIC50743.1 hypothetical protein RA29_02095 [Tateyamaria sp. ANG-S1]